MYQVLARKWRPKTFDELVGQSHVTQALTYALEHNRLHHAYLFTGTRGVGKTTIARIYAKSLNCLKNGVSAHPCGECENCREIDEGRFPDLIEVDAASRRGIDETRELLDNVPYAPVKGRYKVYLIDEVHMFTRESFNALLKTLEEPPEHVKFILATTDPQKLPATVLSRCLQFHLKNMTPVQIAEYLAHVLTVEKIPYEKEALALLAEAANGSMRDSLSLTDQAIAYGQGKVNANEVASLLGAVPTAQLQQLFVHLANGDAKAIREQLFTLDGYAPDYTDLLKRFLTGLQEITVSQLNAQRRPDEISLEMRGLGERLPVELVQLWYQIATETWQNFPYQPDARSALEMMLLRMIALQPLLPMADEHAVAAVPEALPDNGLSAAKDIKQVAEILKQESAAPAAEENASPSETAEKPSAAAAQDVQAPPASEAKAVADTSHQTATENPAAPAAQEQGNVSETSAPQSSSETPQAAQAEPTEVSKSAPPTQETPASAASPASVSDGQEKATTTPAVEQSTRTQRPQAPAIAAPPAQEAPASAAPQKKAPVSDGQEKPTTPAAEQSARTQQPPAPTAQHMTSDDVPPWQEEAAPPWQNDEQPPFPDEEPPYSANTSQTSADEVKKKSPEAPLIPLANTCNQAKAWGKLLAQLPLEDKYCHAMAEQGCPAGIHEDVLQLKLSSAGMLFAKKAHISALATALSLYYHQAWKVEILEDDTISTPAGIHHAHEVAEQKRAEDAFLGHPTVQKLIQELGANVVPGSIHPLQHKKE